MSSTRLASIGLIITLALMPVVVTNTYYVHLLTVVLVFSIAIFGLDLLVGHVGEISLGHFGLFGIGAYTAGLLVTTLGAPLLLALVAASVLTAVFGVILAFPALRTTGPYLAMVTLAFGSIAQIVLNEWTALTNGARGLAAAKPALFGMKLTIVSYYWLVLAAFALTWLVMGRIVNSHYGRAFQALQGSSVAADSLGVSVVNHKLLAFTLSAAFTGLAGGLYVFKEEYVTPASFSFELTIVFLLALIVGGRTSRWGALLGAAMAVWLPNVLGDVKTFKLVMVAATVILAGIAVWQFARGRRVLSDWIPTIAALAITALAYHVETMTEHRLTIFGLILLGAILYLPEGLFGAFTNMFGRSPRIATVAMSGGETTIQSTRSSRFDEAALFLDQVQVAFGGLKAVDKLTMTVRTGQLHGLIGPNGAGKTTVINAITGLYRPTHGKVLVSSKDLTGASMATVARHGVARTFQNIQLFGQMTVLENVVVGRHRSYTSTLLDVVFGLHRFTRDEAQQTQRAHQYLDFVGLGSLANENARNLPYGKQRLLEIARALATEPDIVLLDEPAAGLTPAEIPELIAILQKIKSAGITMLLIEHHMDVVMTLSDQVTVLDFGQKIAEGTPIQVGADPKVIEAYLGASAITH